MARKTRAIERGNLIKTGGGPVNAPTPPQHGAIISMVEEAAPVMICEVQNSFDSDGSVLSSIENKQNDIFVNMVEDEIDQNYSIDLFEIKDLDDTQTSQTGDNLCCEENKVCDDVMELCATAKSKNLRSKELEVEQRKPSDYVRKEGVLRIKHFEAMKKIELQILKAKLENQQIKRRSAQMEEERIKTLLEISKLELEELKKRLG